MSKPLRAEYFGPYKVIRPLGSTRGIDRFVVLCTKTDTNRMLYRFESLSNHSLRRSMFDLLVKMSMLDHPHLLKVESASYDDHGRLCVVTPYTGNHEGLVTLDDLIHNGDGKLGVIESARAIEHLLDAASFAHDRKLVHGPVSPEQIMVDRFGAVQVELYGLRSPREPLPQFNPAVIDDEVRSLVQLGYTMITGLKVTPDRIDPSRVIKKIDRNWDTWFRVGLDPIDGFQDARHALNALPTNPRCSEWLTDRAPRKPQVHIGAMIRRFKTSPSSVASRRSPE